MLHPVLESSPDIAHHYPTVIAAATLAAPVDNRCAARTRAVELDRNGTRDRLKG